MSRRPDELDGPVAVVDIGSNSVRLVIFEGVARHPYPVFNEKALCAIGRHMVSTGRLDEEGTQAALRTLARFRTIATEAGIAALEVVATAAVRDARNGRDFVARAREAVGGPITVLSGEEEAELAALGVLSGIPDADGIVGDLGGGSLELMPVTKGRISGPGQTLPFGPLRLMDLAGERIDRARAIIDEELRQVAGLERLKGRALYAVGGVWRNLARVAMTERRYPLSVLHHFVLDRAAALQVAQGLAAATRRTLERRPEVPRRRIDSLPFGAVVLERLLRASEIDRVVVSANGLREGLLFRRLSPELRARDPLIETARDWAERQGRGAAAGEAIFAFLSPLFADETPAEARLRRAACLLAEIGWRHHPDYRAHLSFEEVLQGPFAGIDHPGRALLAFAVFHRYAGDGEFPETRQLQGLLYPELIVRAQRIGVAARLALNLAGPSAALGDCSVRLGPRELVLGLPRRLSALNGEVAAKRLEALAESFGRAGARIELRD